MTEQRLIDANALDDALAQVQTSLESNEDQVWRRNRGHHKGLATARAIVREAPAIDAAPVVRCKDCKYYRQQRPDAWSDNPMRCDHPELTYDVECYDLWLDVGPEDFCSRGERRGADGADRD